ncbi:hypothetical protein BN948_04335 [Hydrogenophaga intermedia]|uniref:Uncharacterized protein n=1 Tax=Hydrogenophaga intermedia TaxID=65786 RepID=A0A1L1PX56_HYDIT|nr:hypothetical protein BN948_04335 [Hydrogenophaga intermedia]
MGRGRAHHPRARGGDLAHGAARAAPPAARRLSRGHAARGALGARVAHRRRARPPQVAARHGQTAAPARWPCALDRAGQRRDRQRARALARPRQRRPLPPHLRQHAQHRRAGLWAGHDRALLEQGLGTRLRLPCRRGHRPQHAGVGDPARAARQLRPQPPAHAGRARHAQHRRALAAAQGRQLGRGARQRNHHGTPGARRRDLLHRLRPDRAPQGGGPAARAGGATARIAEAGGAGHTGRWRGARLQQHPRGHPGQRAPGAGRRARDARRGRERGRDPQGGRARQGAGAPHPGLQPPPGAAAARDAAAVGGGRIRAPAARHHSQGRGAARAVRPRHALRVGRPHATAAGAAEPVHQRLAGHARALPRLSADRTAAARGPAPGHRVCAAGPGPGRGLARAQRAPKRQRQRRGHGRGHHGPPVRALLHHQATGRGHGPGPGGGARHPARPPGGGAGAQPAR